MRFQVLFFHALLLLPCAAQTCVDSPLDGKFKKGKYYTCKKIKQNKLCSKKNLDSHCPATCEACDEYKCEDTLVKFVEDGKISERDCAWVEKKGKCGKDDFLHTCRASCGYCGTETGNPSSSPSAMPSTSAPTPGPSMDPSSKPSAVPWVPTSEPPATPCVDSKLDGKFKKGKYYTCKKIRQKGYCMKKNLDSHCPVTCEACDEYKCEDTLVKFVENGKTTERDCSWVVRKKKCGSENHLHTCRASCGYCS